jgi:lipopolysaccharide biosynthesis glycosyltransferase
MDVAGNRRVLRPSVPHDRLIFFTTDEGFLLPALNAAVQVSERRPAADIAVFLVGLSDDLFSKVEREFSPYGLIFFRIGKGDLELADYSAIKPTHLGPSALARLVAAKLIPEQYEHLIYLDGDIQVVGDIAPLVQHDVAPGKILAAAEPMFLCSSPIGRTGRTFRNYARALGLSDPASYFNSGIMAFRRKTWVTIAEEALNFLCENTSLCWHYDQSALNAVVGNRRELLHPSFNYQPLFAKIGSGVEPSIIHFVGPMKPWHRTYDRLAGDWYSTYRRLVSKHPFLWPYWNQGPEIAYPEGEGLLNKTVLRQMQRYRFARHLKNSFDARPNDACASRLRNSSTLAG